MQNSFSWSAFDESRWDHFYHAGQQIRFYRQQPPHLAAIAFEKTQPAWVNFFLRCFERFAR